MKVTEELDAIETMALHPITFLVTPKLLLAMLVMMPCLTIWADLMGRSWWKRVWNDRGNYNVWSVSGRDARCALHARHYHRTRKEHRLWTCHHRSRLPGRFLTGGRLRARSAGRSTTSAVVTSIFVVVFVDLIFTAVFYMTSGT